jgi:hypothetical protein
MFHPNIDPMYILPVIDLNLIRAFVTIYETGSVSAAAERLHISQPSVSYTLKRLRDLLREPLFKRTREGMAPTYFARSSALPSLGSRGRLKARANSIHTCRAGGFAWRCPTSAK